MRAKLAAALEEATELKQQTRLATLRLINAAIRDRLSALRSDEGDDVEAAQEGRATAEILDLLETMIAQREESAREYEESGRLELAQRERDEIAVIREFLPRPMTDVEAARAVADAIEAVGAEGIRDITKVMAELKRRYAGRMDFCDAGARVRRSLCDRVRAPVT